MPPARLWVPCVGLGAPPCSVGRSGRLPGLAEAFRIPRLGFSIQAAKQKSHYSPAQRQRPRAWLGAGTAWGGHGCEGVQECGKGLCPPCTLPHPPVGFCTPKHPPVPAPAPVTAYRRGFCLPQAPGCSRVPASPMGSAAGPGLVPVPWGCEHTGGAGCSRPGCLALPQQQQQQPIN